MSRASVSCDDAELKIGSNNMHSAADWRDYMQAEGEKLSLDLLLLHMQSGINIFSDTERELLQQGRTMS